MTFYPAQHKIGVCGRHLNAGCQELLFQSLGFGQVGAAHQFVVAQQEFARLNGNCRDVPRAQETAHLLRQTFVGGDIAQPQSRYGVSLCERMDLYDAVCLASPFWCHQG